jgi:hypothetical protein
MLHRVRPSGLSDPERVLDGPSANAHAFGCAIQLRLHGLDHSLMFPALALFGLFLLLMQTVPGASSSRLCCSCIGHSNEPIICRPLPCSTLRLWCGTAPGS